MAGKSGRDPVCGMKVDPHSTAHHAGHDSHRYYFCSAGCRARFIADPGKHGAPVASQSRQAAPAGTIYTCPIHPEIRQVGPGACPLCGMALEPATRTDETPPNPELADFTRRFWIGLAFTVPVFVRGWRSLVNRSLNMFTLVAMGTGVARGYSVVGNALRLKSAEL